MTALKLPPVRFCAYLRRAQPRNADSAPLPAVRVHAALVDTARDRWRQELLLVFIGSSYNESSRFPFEAARDLVVEENFFDVVIGSCEYLYLLPEVSPPKNFPWNFECKKFSL